MSTEPPQRVSRPFALVSAFAPETSPRLPRTTQRTALRMGDARMVSAHQRESEQGVREVSSALFNRVTNYHAQIGANVNKETLQSLEWQVLRHRAL